MAERQLAAIGTLGTIWLTTTCSRAGNGPLPWAGECMLQIGAEAGSDGIALECSRRERDVGIACQTTFRRPV